MGPGEYSSLRWRPRQGHLNGSGGNRTLDKERILSSISYPIVISLICLSKASSKLCLPTPPVRGQFFHHLPPCLPQVARSLQKNHRAVRSGRFQPLLPPLQREAGSQVWDKGSRACWLQGGEKQGQLFAAPSGLRRDDDGREERAAFSTRSRWSLHERSFPSQ